MSFDRAWVLLFALLPAAWVVWEWRRPVRKSSLLLKAGAFLCVMLALAEPRLRVVETKVAVAVLVDTSASVSDEDLARASQLASSIESARGRHFTRVVPFARSWRPAEAGERASVWKLRHTAGEPGQATDLESALREGIATLPAGLAPRVVLISDGKENRGSVARGAALAQQLGVPVDTFALAGRPKPGLTIETVTMPAVAFTGEKFAIDLAVISPRRSAGVVEITAQGKTLGASPVAIEAGANHLRVHASISEPGAIDVAGTIRVPGLGDTRFSQALALRRPKLLYVSDDPADAGRHLLGTLRAAQFDIDAGRDALTPKLDDYQLAVFNNWDLESLPASRKTGIEEYVKQGGGLLVIGGDRNIYLERKRTEEDPLERAMPAKLAPPRSPEGTCVVLIMDKSSSMEGRKMELARLAAIGVVENLRAVDMLGVLIFDNSFQWSVPIRRAEDRALLKRLVAGIMPDGGTQIAPALAEAYRRVLPVKATFKHIVLLTDGISEEGDSISVSKEAGLQRVTISTVGLGQDVNRAYLEKVATFSKGKAYFLTDPSGLEQILLRDVLEHTGSTAVEKTVTPAVLRKVELLEGVAMESAPALKGYVRFIAKPTAETILRVDDKDPLLARWQYGLGRSIVFASDAKSRWAQGWVSWKGYDRFWANVARDLLPHSQAGEARVEYDSASGELVVDYLLGRHIEAPAAAPDIFVFGPDGFQRPVEVRKVAEGAWRGRVAVGDRQGLFRIRPLADSRAFPEVGLYRAVDELREYGNDEPLLRRVAEFTGGGFNPRPADVFDSGGRAIPATLRLWPLLLGLAILLNLAELILRKWRGVLETLIR
ncbi:MAG: VWA domain-containing protein [Acidobacteria bacterium]|nr:VWA domain-containing protein [Acidobacteriota bacterium]